MTPDQPSRDDPPDLSSSPIDLGSGVFFSLTPSLEQIQIPKNLKPIEEAAFRFGLSATLGGALPQTEAGTLCQYQRYSTLIKRLLDLDSAEEDPLLKSRETDYQIVPIGAAVGTDADVTILIGVKDTKTKSWVVFNSAVQSALQSETDRDQAFLDRCARIPEKDGFAGISLYLHPQPNGLGIYLSIAILPKNLERECTKFINSEPSVLTEIIASAVERVGERPQARLTLLSTGADTSNILKEFLLSSDSGAKYACTFSFPSPGLSLFKHYLLRFTDLTPADLANSPEQRLVSAYEDSQRKAGLIVTNLENGEGPDDEIGLALTTNSENLLRHLYSNNWREEWKVAVINICKIEADDSCYVLYSIQDDKLDCYIPGEVSGVVAKDPLFAGIILGYHYQDELAEEASTYLPAGCSVTGQLRIEGALVSPEWVSKQLGLLKTAPPSSVLYGTLERLIMRDLEYRLNQTPQPGGITVEFAPVATMKRDIVGAALLCSHAHGKHLVWFRYDKESGLLEKDLGLTIETYYRS